MSFERASEYLKQRGFGDRIMQFNVSSATVELAAKAAGTVPARIAKSMTFKVNDKPVMIILAGDTRIDNHLFKDFFHTKATMLTGDEVEGFIGHQIGGVCPFGIREGVTVYLDDALRRFDYVYPACGDAQSAVRLTPEELFDLSGAADWCHVSKLS